MLRLPFPLRSKHLAFTPILTLTILTACLCSPGNSCADVVENRDLDRCFGESVLTLVEPNDRQNPSSLGDVCGLGTHDSGPFIRIASQPRTPCQASKRKKALGKSIKRAERKRPDHASEKMVATIATSVGASVGVSVQQMLEPFAMIGPDGNSTLDEIAWLTKYWTHPESLPFAKVIDADAITVDAPAASIAQDDVDFGIVSYVPFVDFDGLIESQPNPANPLASSAEIGSHLSIQSNELSRIDWQSHDDDGFRVVGSEDVIRMQQDTPGLQEPNDVAQIGQKAEVSLAKDALAVGPAAVSDQPREADSREKIGINSAKDAPRRLVGSSGFVATIEQVLLPYEFATQTQLRRNLFPLQSGAYCVVERVTLEGLQPEESTESDVALDAGVEEPFDDSSPAMDEVISKIRLALEQKPQWRRWVRVKNYGRYLGRFASLANGSASVVTRKLASEWPEASIANETAGEKLLTRAGAFVEDGEPIPSQIDQVRIDQFRQTVESWYQATVSMQEWFRVAQRHANESDDGRNRSKRLR